MSVRRDEHSESLGGRTRIYSNFVEYLKLSPRGTTSAIAGTAALVIDASGPILRVRAASGTADLALGATGAMTGLAPISGVATLQLGATGIISTGYSSIAGTASLSFGADATLDSLALLNGTAALSFSANGVLHELVTYGDLAGFATLTLSADATLGAISQINGHADMVLGALANGHTLNPIVGVAEMVFNSTSTSLLGAIVEKSGIATLTFGATGVLNSSGNGYLARRLTRWTNAFDQTWFQNLRPNALDTGVRTLLAQLNLSANGTLTGTAAGAGASALVLGATGTLTGKGALSGVASMTLNAVNNNIGAMQGVAALTFDATMISGLKGQADLAFGANATLIGIGNMQGVAALNFGATALAPVDSGMHGLAELRFTAIMGQEFRGIGRRMRPGWNTLYPWQPIDDMVPGSPLATVLAGRADLTLNATATLGGIGKLEGVAYLSFDAVGGARGAIAGLAELKFSALATPRAIGTLEGSAELAFDANAGLTAATIAAGLAEMQFIAIGRLTNKAAWTPDEPRPPGWHPKPPKPPGWNKNPPKPGMWIKERPP